MIRLIELFSAYWDPKSHVEANAHSVSGFQGVTFHFTDHILPFRFFCQSPSRLRENSTPAPSVLRNFNRYSNRKRRWYWTAEGSLLFLLQFMHLFPDTGTAKQYHISLHLHCIYRMTESNLRCPSTLKQLSADHSWTDLESHAWVKFYPLRQVMLCLELLLHLTLAVINYHLADWHISE